jgi:hypothetical protein
MYCHYCGTQLPAGANFCASCGTKTISGASIVTEPELAPTSAAPVTPILPTQGLRVLQHAVGVMIVCLATPNIWKSPNLEFGFGLWSVYPALSLGLAGLITGIAFVFYQQKMKSIWPDVFIRTAWAVTGISLLGAYLTLSSR